MDIKYQELVKKLESGEKGGIFLFLGDEMFLKERAIRQIQQNVFGSEAPGMNMERLSASLAEDAERFVLLARTHPFLARGRLLILDGVDKLDKKVHDKMAALAQSSIPDTTTLVITSGERSLDKRKKSMKALMEAGRTTVFWPLFENQLPGFIVTEAAAQGKRMEPQAVELLIKLVGRDLSDLSMEIAKLALYAGQEKNILAQDVKTLVDDRFDSTLYNVVEFISSGKPAQATELAWELLERDPGIAVGLVKVLSDTYSAALQGRMLMGRCTEMAQMMNLVKEWALIGRKSDFRSNQRKSEIKREISKLSSQTLQEYPFFTGLLKAYDTRVLTALRLAAGMDANGLCLSLEALGEADSWLKGGRTMSQQGVLMICMSRLTEYRNNSRQR